jgi:beta-galactosidase
MHERHVQVDLVRPGGPLRDYALVLAPSLYLLRDNDAAVLRQYVAAGGHLLVTAFSDVVDEHDRFRPGGFTRQLGPVLGLSVLDFDGVLPGEAAFDWHGPVQADVLTEVVELHGAAVLARFVSGPGAGAPALTRNDFGAGTAFYVATMPDPAGRAAIAGHLLDRTGIEPVLPGLPPRVEACARGDVVTIINHTPEPVEVTLPGGEAVVLQPFGYRLMR